MSLNPLDGRMRLKRSLLSGSTPTIGPSTDHTDGTWTATTMIYPGELYYNVPDDRLWIGNTTGVSEIVSQPSGTTKLFQILTDAATITWGWDLGFNAAVTLTADRTLSITGVTDGDYGTIKMIQDGGGGHSITLPGNSKVANGGGGSITLTATGGAIDILSFVYDGTDFNWNVSFNYT